MSNKFTGDLVELQTLLRQAMLAWHHHRTGAARLNDAKAFEDMLIAANFALAEIRLDIMAFEKETASLVGDFQRELDKSQTVLRQAMDLFDRMLKMAPPAAPALPSNVLVFTGSYRPTPANDAPAPGGVA